jgi:hypothetical protein
VTGRGVVTALAALALLASGCGGDGGGGGDAKGVLAETAEKLGEIRSGELHLSVLASSDENQIGFELSGPFALPEDGGLPVAEIEYTQIAGDESESATFISTGEEAFVRVGEQTYVLPQDQVDLEFGGTGPGESGLGELRIDSWLENPELSDGGDLGGDETDKITADLNPVATANDLLALVAGLSGRRAPTLEGRSAEQLERAVKSSRIEVFTGTDDRLLRRLVIAAHFAATLPQELEDLTLPEAQFELVLELANPNEPVEVEAPEDAEPFPG